MRALLITAVLLTLTGCLNEEGEDEMSTIETLGRWERLSKGQALGKRIVIAVPDLPFGAQRPGTVDMIQIKGDDRDACQIAVTLIPPKARVVTEMQGGVFPPDAQTIAGTRTPASLFASPPPGGVYFAPPAVAVVQWGIGGVQSEAEVDFSSGAVINLNASFVRVGAFIDLPAESFPVGVAIELGAFVGPGFPKSPSGQRSYNVLTLLAGPNGFPDLAYGPNGYITPLGGLAPLFPVPNHAKQVTVLATDPNVVGPSPSPTTNTLDADIIFYRNNTATSPAGAFHVTNARPGPIPVPNGAVYWSVQNNVATSQNLQVIFDLNI